MKKNFRRVVGLVLAMLMLLTQVAMASNVPEGKTCYITVTIEDDIEHIKVSDTSSKYLTGESPLAIEVVSLIQKNYNKMYLFRSPAMKAIMDEGLRAFTSSDAAWVAYVDKYYEDVGGSGVKAIVREKTSTLGDLVPNVANTMIFENKVVGDPKYGTTYTVTITLRVAGQDIENDPAVNGVGNLMELGHIAYMQGDEQGNFRPTDSITRKEVAQMLYNLLKNKEVATTTTFEDVPVDEWYTKAVHAIATLGIIEGDGQGHFFPDANITRAQFVTMIARFAQAVNGDVTFTDVAEDYWAYDYISTAVGYGWINGRGDGTFDPDAAIARAEVVEIMNKVLVRYADKDYVDANLGTLKTFPDVEKEYWAYYQIFEATNTHDFARKDSKAEIWNP